LSSLIGIWDPVDMDVIFKNEQIKEEEGKDEKENKWDIFKMVSIQWRHVNSAIKSRNYVARDY
jgi:hypothetical protein